MVSEEKLRDLITNRAEDVSSSRLITSSRVWLEVGDLMSREVAVVGPEHTIVEAARIMAEDSISSLVVLDDGRVAGIITETDFLKGVVAQGKDADSVKVREVMSQPVVSVSPDVSVFEAGEIVEDRRVKRLPVLDGGKLVGIVTQTDLIRVLTSYGMWRDVVEIMTRDVATVQRGDSVAKVAEMMSAHSISGIVVMDAKQVVGVLTERDLLRRVMAQCKDPAKVKVEEVMSSPVMSVPPYYSVFSSSRIMEKTHVRRLVVEDNGRLCGVVTQTDIFRAVEDRFRRDEEKNFQLLEESESCVYTLDLEGGTTYANPAFMRLLGIGDRAELVGKSFLPERFWFNSQDRRNFLQQLKQGAVEIKDLTLKTATGKRIDVTVFSSFTKNIHGKINGSQGVLYDITDKKELVTLKETERALRASEERYRRITESVTDYVFTVCFEDGRATETIHSETSVAVTGYTPHELRADRKLWFNMVHPDDWESVREQLEQCISGQEVKPLEHRIVRKDGTVRWVKRTLIPNFDSDGTLLSYDGSWKDITELKLAELAQMQLLGELTEATQELRDFAHVASHDLKAPLRGISALAGWISTDYADKLGEEGRKQIELLMVRVTRMYNLIDGILQYSLVARLKENKVQVDLNEVVDEVVVRLAPPDNIVVNVEKKLPVIICCESGINQVFYHLLSNAVSYMDKPDGRVTVGWSEERDFWKFSVWDNGPGIEERYFDRIFKIFQTLAPRDRVESTGVGLAIAKKVVQSWGGRIWVKSRPGVGSTFFFTMPKQDKMAGKTLATVGAVG